QTSPADWIRQRLGEWVWSKQEEICQSVVDNKYTAVKACHGPGKSFIAARIGCWWLDVHELGDAFLETTAPSWPQVSAILWREMRGPPRRASLPGVITFESEGSVEDMGKKNSSRGKEFGPRARNPADYDKNASRGLPPRYTPITLDEAWGTPPSL